MRPVNSWWPISHAACLHLALSAHPAPNSGSPFSCLLLSSCCLAPLAAWTAWCSLHQLHACLQALENLYPGAAVHMGFLQQAQSVTDKAQSSVYNIRSVLDQMSGNSTPTLVVVTGEAGPVAGLADRKGAC